MFISTTQELQFHKRMRTRSGANDEPESSQAHQPPPNPPPAPTLADAVANLINLTVDNSRLLHAIA
jgi:hypothetical protein